MLMTAPTCRECGLILDDNQAMYWQVVAHDTGQTHTDYLCYLCVPDELVELIACTAGIPGFWHKDTFAR